jgi:hypothetical protein
MRTYLVTISRVFCVFSLAALTGCLSSGATPPGANAPCSINDDCPSGYQCISPANASPGKLFCCKDKNSCGPTGSGGASGGAIDGGGAASGGAIAIDGPSSKGGAVDVASAGGASGSITLDGGLAGAGGGIVLAGGSTSSGGIAGGLASGGSTGGPPASGGVLIGGIGSGGTGSGGIVAAGGSGGGLDAARDVPAPVGDAPILLPLGKACAADTDCALGNCVDGLCCNKSKTACGGCNACTNALTGLDDGTCGAVSAGKIAHSACTDETATKPCGSDGTCDGSGACRKVSSSHVCTPASCSTDGKTFTASTTCDGKGACTTATAQPCGAFQCATTGCLQTCTVQADCVGSNYCNTAVTPAVCASKKVNGSTASQTYECTSGVVADGVCCDKACSGCSACTLALNGQTGASVANGQCLAVVAGQVGHSTCTASPPCGLDGKCDGNGACRYTAAGTSCAADSCLGSTLTTKACDTSHACTPSTGACPGQLICGSAAACKPNCAADTDCTAGNYCASGTCTPKLGNGANCTTSNQCPSGNTCVEGVCCNSACGTACHSCLASKTGGATGTCAAVTDTTACGSGQYCSAGTCTTGCAIGGTVYATGAVNPVNSCQSCQPSTPTLWSSLGNGTSCGTGKVCSGGNCQTGCWIGGGFILSGGAGPTTCQICTPTKSTSGWSNNDGASVACGTCSGTAACVSGAPGTCSKTATTYYRDADGDGYGDPTNSTSSCSPLSGYVSQGGDCDDSDNWVHPGGLGHCQSYENPSSYDNNTLNTCTSNGTWSQSTCPYGCAAGQCRSLETVTVSGQVTCGAVQCPTYQGCAFTSTGGDYHGVCNAGTAPYSSSCDGPSDCSGGQVCCYISGVYAHQTQCMDSSSCPYPYNMGLTQGFLVCNPNVGACPAGTTCQLSTSSSPFFANIAFSIYTCQ